LLDLNFILMHTSGNWSQIISPICDKLTTVCQLSERLSIKCVQCLVCLPRPVTNLWWWRHRSGSVRSSLGLRRFHHPSCTVMLRQLVRSGEGRSVLRSPHRASFDWWDRWTAHLLSFITFCHSSILHWPGIQDFPVSCPYTLQIIDPVLQITQFLWFCPSILEFSSQRSTSYN
jgi:hypothetical protein